MPSLIYFILSDRCSYWPGDAVVLVPVNVANEILIKQTVFMIEHVDLQLQRCAPHAADFESRIALIHVGKSINHMDSFFWHTFERQSNAFVVRCKTDFFH